MKYIKYNARDDEEPARVNVDNGKNALRALQIGRVKLHLGLE